MSRDRCEVDGDGGDGGGGPIDTGEVSEDFQSGNDNDSVDLDGWSNVATEGARTWLFKEFEGNVYAQATAFNDTAPNMEAYLITPPVDFDEVTNLTFRAAVAFYTHLGLELIYSTDFDGNPNAATWNSLDSTLPDSNSGQFEWIQSGDVDLSGISGIGVVGFRYTGSGPSGDTNSILVDDVVIN